MLLKDDLQVFNQRQKLENYLNQIDMYNKNLLLMSSGNFAGMDLNKLTENILQKLTNNKIIN
jgi:UDP-N-acetylmuramate: L-alanyl-gamma-D-glutamyl-meso-diaminopimelate ligase